MRRVVITGMPGCGMREVAARLKDSPNVLPPRFEIQVQDVGDMMFYIDTLGHPEPPSRTEWEEKILDQPRSALAALRKAVFRTIVANQALYHEEEKRISDKTNAVLVLVHATFWWRHAVQIGTPFVSVEELQPEMFITVIDNLETVAERLYRQRRWLDLSLQEILWWRNVETTTTAAVASALRKPHYVLARQEDIRTLANLIARPEMKCVYGSYPMSHVGDDELRASQQFIDELRKHFVVFDPSKITDVEYAREGLHRDYASGERIDINHANRQLLVALPGVGPKLADRIIKHRRAYGRYTSVADLQNVPGIGQHLPHQCEPLVSVSDELHGVRMQLDHQTACRDYDLIDQSDYVMVHYTRAAPDEQHEDTNTRLPMPLSAGVICEMKHAYTHGKHVYAVWQSEQDPSPFFDFYCTAWKRTKEELLALLRDEGIISE